MGVELFLKPIEAFQPDVAPRSDIIIPDRDLHGSFIIGRLVDHIHASPRPSLIFF